MQQQRRCSIALVVALLSAALILTTAVAAAADSTATCASPAECCELCGDDSIRCARGPCSTSFVPKTFFSISLPTTDVGFWDVVFAFYGMVPYIVPIALALALLLLRRQRTWTRVFAFIFIPIVAAINALVFVLSLGDCTECARPCGACVPSNGMPSGHSSNSIGLCLWVLLESLYGVGRLHQWSIRKRLSIILSSIALFAPVPYSRMYLGDHTELQVVVGAANGVVFGFLYFVLLRYVVAKRLKPQKQAAACSSCCTITNDFSAPRDDGDDDAAVRASSSLHQQLLSDDRRSREDAEGRWTPEQVPVATV